MNNLYDSLESCLLDIENGADVEAVLLRYSDIADELRPILQASVNAKSLAAPNPSVDVIRRNRARLLHRASEMRASSVRPVARDMWFASLRRLAVTMLVLVTVFGSGAGLVRASSNTLPGDNLYPLKRTWEDVALLLTFDLQKRESLAVEYENERLEECYELIADGRSAEVDFAGIVTQQNGDEWLVSGIRIVISPQTDFRDGPVSVGDPVRVFGIVQGNDSVLVERIDQLPPGAQLPDIENSGSESNSGSGSGKDNNSNDVANENDSSGPGNGNDNSNDNNSGPGGGNDNENNSGSGGGNDNNSDPDGGNDNENSNNSGSGGGMNSGNDNSNDDNSGSGSDNNNSNEDNSGSGSGSDNGNEDNSGSGGGGSDDNGNEDNSNSNGNGD